MRSLVVFLQDIKFQHTIFALPFAAAALVLCLPNIQVTFAQIALLLACMFFARTFAMGANRFFDAIIDQKNPRTAKRAVPGGRLGANRALLWTLISGGFFIFFSFQLSFVAGLCSVPVLFLFTLYPFMKRWTIFTHLFLGLCLGLSPLAVQVALTGVITLPYVLLGLAIMFWTAGFDILYALQDLDFDRASHLQSIPAKLGYRRAIFVSRLLFSLMILLLVALGWTQQFGVYYFAGVMLVATLLAFEHYLVRKSIELAFFNINACVSIVFFLGVFLEHLA